MKGTSKNSSRILDYNQLCAVSKMRDGCILNGGVGSGKSRTALYYYCTKHPNMPLLIITTAATRDKHDWDRELILFNIDQPYTVDSWNNIKKYANTTGHFIIFDEDKLTGSGIWVKTFLKMSRKNKWIVLSATPGDKWIEYWSLFVANGFVKNKTEFQQNYCIYQRYSSFPNIIGYQNVQELEAFRKAILVDIKVESHVDMHYINVVCDYDKDMYETVKKYNFDPFTDTPIATAADRCRIFRHVVNVSEDRQMKLLELLENIDRVIIFYNYNFELDILKDIINDRRVAEWNGHKHQDIPDTKKWAYLVQFSACEGWNCIKTNIMIFYSQSYSYKIIEQARGRINRRNTSFSDLYYYTMTSESPIDKAIEKAVKNKTVFNEKKYVEAEKLYNIKEL